jgi:hypothetical protein
MRFWGFAALGSALLLAGCGSGSDAEDFTVEIKRPAAVVYAPLLAVDVQEARMVFPGITFQRSQPAEGEILYTIPGNGSFPTTIRLKLEGKDGGARTVVHAFVKAPEVRLALGGKDMVLSERKIEGQLQSLLKSTGRSLEMGSSAKAETQELSTLMFALAVATNEKQMARLLDFKNNPEKLTQLLLAFSGLGGSSEPSVNGSAIRSVDPDAAQEKREYAETDAEWKQEQALNQAAAPTTNVERSERNYDY